MSDFEKIITDKNVKEVYLVVSKFFDSGKVLTNIEVRHFVKKGLPSNYNYSTNNCDVYCDYFDTLIQAQKFAEQAKKA